MALQRVTLRLTQLRCLKQQEGSGGIEPYLWVTFFALGTQPSPTDIVVFTPAWDGFRDAFPNGVKAGQTLPIPSFIAAGRYDIDLEVLPTFPRMIGCVALVMEENDTRTGDIVAGYVAYAKEIEIQLKALIQKRLSTQNREPITEAEAKAIEDAVEAKVKEAAGRTWSIWDVFKTHDSPHGFTSQVFTADDIRAIPSSGTRPFDFPQIDDKDDGEIVSQFVLSGELVVGPIPPATVEVCTIQRNAVNAKTDEINALHVLKGSLQARLAGAPPQAKAAIIKQIERTGVLIEQAEAELPPLRQALAQCLAHPEVGIFTDPPRDANLG